MNEKLIFVVDDEIQVLKLYKKAFEKLSTSLNLDQK